MFFYMPTKLYSEKNCVSNHQKELAALGTNALIISGKTSSRKNGSFQAITDALQAESITYHVFDDIEENPSVETIMKAREFGIQKGCDFVIGIGGGSPLDASKAIALMIANPNATADTLYQNISLPSLPVAAVPTTAGTGSEVTPYAILTLHTEKTKRSISHHIFPALALADSTYLETLPKNILVHTAVDALGHLIESYLNVHATTYSKMLCEYGFSLWGTYKTSLKEYNLTKDDFENMMNASSIAGMAISHTGTSLPHGMSYYLTYEKGIPHGKAVGIFLPAYLNAEPDTSKSSFILKQLGFENLNDFKAYIHNLLGDITLNQEDINRYIEGMLKNQSKLANCPFPVNRTIMENLYYDLKVKS